jgi:ankyrin repeat protein
MAQPSSPLGFENMSTNSTEANENGTLLYSACENGDYDSLAQLILNGADVNGTDDGRPLIAAASNGHKHCVQLLLQHGAKVNNLNRQGQSALMTASRNLFMDIVEVLDAGAKPSIKDFDFQHCTEQLSLSCTRKLVNVLSANQLSFVKLSQFAFGNARLDLTEYPLEKESDSTVAQHYSFGLYYATKHDWLDVARHLLDRGVRVNSCRNSKTALRCACKYGCLNIAQLLLKRGAKPYRHRSTKTDLLPIQFCCRNGNEKLLKLLLDSSSLSRMSNYADQLHHLQLTHRCLVVLGHQLKSSNQ